MLCSVVPSFVVLIIKRPSTSCLNDQLSVEWPVVYWPDGLSKVTSTTHLSNQTPMRPPAGLDVLFGSKKRCQTGACGPKRCSVDGAGPLGLHHVCCVLVSLVCFVGPTLRDVFSAAAPGTSRPRTSATTLAPAMTDPDYMHGISFEP